MKRILKIAITGPESTGKSTLAKELASHFNTVFTKEYSREYLSRKDGSYAYEEIVKIAKGQFLLEEQSIVNAKEYLFCDSDMLVHKIWSEMKYAKCDPWILEKFLQNNYELYLLCKPDIDWEYDPLRESEHLREVLFERYLTELKNNSFHYEVVTGSGKARLANAIEIINNFAPQLNPKKTDE